MNRRRNAVLLFVATLCLCVTLAGRSHAAGTYKFCANWQYQFGDQNLGEDYFKYSGTFGTLSAAYTWAIVQRDNQHLWAGYLDSFGCSAAVSALAGTYTLFITAGIQTPSGAVVGATPQQSPSTTRWFTATRTLAGLASGSTSYTSSLGAGDTTAGAISLAIGLAQKLDGRFVNGFTYSIYTELGGNEGYYSNGAVFLGTDEYTGTWVSRLKTVVLHELGHAVQDRLFGFQYKTYDENSTVQLCQCDHIDWSALRRHCLQSREHIGAAQTEGFAHYHAATLLNNPAQADGSFAYYKEFRQQNGGPDVYPPVMVSAFYPTATFHWMESQGCIAYDRSTELDWMTFLYEVGTKTANKYTIGDIANAFKGACGGVNCTNATTTTWTTLQNSVNARFGASSAKALYWAQMGDWHGVNW